MTAQLDPDLAEARFRAVFSHLGAVTAYVRRRGSADADAIAAEAMTIAWRRLADVPQDDPLPWLYATARNLGAVDPQPRRRRPATRARRIYDLMTNHVVIAPKGASENWSPPQTGVPTAVYADDGGYQFKQRAYAEAAAGNAQLLEERCRANAPPGWGG